MNSVYIETSIVSHASAWPSRNPATAVLQDQAKRWLAQEASKCDLVTSQFVIDEVSLGDPAAAKKRLVLLQDVRVLIPDADVERVADEIISHSLMPAKARLDALHVASAAVGRVEYPLTQNCRHIANASELPRVYDLLEDLGFPRLLICTPAEFLGDLENGS
ncbi:MAG: type II toxin-antitoxin system VapC family toxin [Planctomycetota bacterium]